MKLENEHGQYYLSFDDGKGFVHAINDWLQLFGRFNWYSFHLLHLYFEKDVMVGESYELSMAILGLGFTLRWTPKIDPELEERINSLPLINKSLT